MPSPIIAAAQMFPGKVDSGMGRRALDATWRHFVRRGALKNRALTMGYYSDDPRVVNDYSGPGSYHWGLRSVTLAFMAPPDAPFWTSAQQPLPVERGDYRLELPKLGWTVVGQNKTLDIHIKVTGNTARSIQLEPHAWWRELSESFFERPNRPRNKSIRYGLAATPLGGELERKVESSD